MINDFLDLLKEDIVSTIEGLIGIAPEVSLKEQTDAIGDLTPPLADIEVEISGDSTGKIRFLITPQSATALGDMMLAGEGEEKDSMDDEDLDAIKEIVSNIFGSLSTALTAQQDLPKLSFSVTNASFKTEEDSDWIGNIYKVVYDFAINGKDYDWIVLFDKDIYSNLNSSNNHIGETEESNTNNSANGNGASNNLEFDAEEIKNLKLLLDVKLNLRVRIGSKKMLLKDVINMDIGSIVELNQLANEPLDVLVDNKKIAEGEVVIVDGNFGIQITSIGSKKERMNALNS